MKHVVILSAFLSPLRSGAEACAEEVPAQLQQQFRFTLVTAKMQRNLPRKDELNGIPVIRVGIGATVDKWLYPFLAPVVVMRLRPDVIHAILETFAGLALHICKFVAPSAKRILTCQTTNRSFLKGMIVRSPHVVTVISRALSELLHNLGRGDVERIPNGITGADFAAARAEYDKVPGRILFVGRLEPQKGVDTLLQACTQLSGECHLRIVGDGSQRTFLENSAPDGVAFVGRVSPDVIAREFAQAEIFCGLSRSEALGNVFIEAQAAGCAVVATRVGGIPDIVDEILVPVDDADAAAHALQTLLDQPELRMRLAEAGIKKASQYDWSTIATQYAALY